MTHDPTLLPILESAWRMLTLASADPRHGFHWPVLASAALDGGPDARTVVLRAVDTDTRTLQVHSDTDTGKLAQLARDPRVCLVFHDGPARTQLRARGRALIHVGDPVAQIAWQRLPAHSRALYAGIERFAVLAIGVEHLDWLLLDAAGHRRAGFDWPAGQPRAVSLRP